MTTFVVGSNCLMALGGLPTTKSGKNYKPALRALDNNLDDARFDYQEHAIKTPTSVGVFLFAKF